MSTRSTPLRRLPRPPIRTPDTTCPLGGDIRHARAVTRVRGPIKADVAGDVAWATSASTTTNNADGTKSSGAELMVLRKRDGAWRIVAVHWSSRRGT